MGPDIPHTPAYEGGGPRVYVSERTSALNKRTKSAIAKGTYQK
jgi:hypothetical protein